MKKSGCAILALFLALCVSIFVICLLLLGLGTKAARSVVRAEPEKKFEEQVLAGGKGPGKIAVIPLEGIIAYGASGALGDSLVQDLKAAFRQAADDPSIKAVVMSVDSPGGEVTASDAIYHEIQKFARRKPVVYFMNSIGASGAYYAACGSSWVMCNETTFTGSIGVIISTLNYRELFGKIGLQAVVFKSGKFKDLLNGARDMTPEEQAYVQGLVLQSYGKFVGIVAKARKLDEASLRSGIADGRILSGTDAYQAKLVDQLGYIEDAYDKARELSGAQGASVVLYKRAFSFSNLFQLFGQSSQAKADIKIDLLQGLPDLKPGRVYLLPPFFAP
ncbi:MAG: signal peptide peptidase SppA [Terrimicrobiaceae bacterium]|nr:signal peptide peptidase SppA [Terrimicrobiaceae bacterium]